MTEQNNEKQINNMKVDMGKIQKDLEYLKDSAEKANKRNDKEHAELKQMIKDFIESADNRYASKNMEKIVQGLLLTTVGGIAVAIVVAVFKFLVP